ncbi:protein of unknown function [Blastococcus saxobsidens DD2]|uniref:Uncharacterized protein n=1 Tax=Blastococcus saxobsidens (strain DD2) TaxID=1146883 RepID=H6RRT6_BLASD|nr:protein of unknown function [Blastococcus saxobsidens DD2]
MDIGRGHFHSTLRRVHLEPEPSRGFVQQRQCRHGHLRDEDRDHRPSCEADGAARPHDFMWAHVGIFWELDICAQHRHPNGVRGCPPASSWRCAAPWPCAAGERQETVPLDRNCHPQ